ncbi:hypothetical protein [Allokutzneria oryzae]|uniref:Uncharacterized protein n=1 Tax=Allokutzneria oryzae TaxID=1378989 RepID=A0ABV5ZZE2_9PSEU
MIVWIVLGAVALLTVNDVAPPVRVLATVVLLGAAVLYPLICAAFPYRVCRACRGSMRQASPVFGGFRECRACSGTGERLRLGARLARRRRDRVR